MKSHEMLQSQQNREEFNRKARTQHRNVRARSDLIALLSEQTETCGLKGPENEHSFREACINAVSWALFLLTTTHLCLRR
jgi:hypothetical protein